MSKDITKCDHCAWIDYLDLDRENKSRCPECGSSIIKIPNPFVGEEIEVEILDYRRQKNSATIKFEAFEDRFDRVIGSLLKDTFPVLAKRHRVEFLMKVYIWTLLKSAPILWGSINTHIDDLKELMILKTQKEGNDGKADKRIY